MTSRPLHASRKAPVQGKVQPTPRCESGSATTTPQSRSVPRLGVHSADINDPAVNARSEDRWNAEVSPRGASPMQG